MKHIEIMMFEGCPHMHAALERAHSAAASTGVASSVSVVRIGSLAEAVDRRFLGSPSVRVDGIDVEPAARGRIDFGIQCRLYPVGSGFEAAPPVTWIAAALRGE
ncbi:hypothetical protein LZC95_40380 [Pendulispora brunnea]|uniref:Alkylmercury lyase n=1 Tax=Pendulispora brunnea TaxID=2905690 RepID=A0ABZ2K5Q8_9BACT